jgi:hypothetical protein
MQKAKYTKEKLAEVIRCLSVEEQIDLGKLLDAPISLGRIGHLRRSTKDEFHSIVLVRRRPLKNITLGPVTAVREVYKNVRTATVKASPVRDSVNAAPCENRLVVSVRAWRAASKKDWIFLVVSLAIGGSVAWYLAKLIVPLR